MSKEAGNRTFTPDQERALICVLNEIIPSSGDGKMPGAGDIGLVAQILAAVEQRPELGASIARGLSALDGVARRKHADGFATLSREAKVAALEEVAAAEEGFLIGLMFPTFVAYYQHPRVLEGLGREPRPPFPQGFEVPPFDLTLVDPVRRRGKMYRDCD